MWMLRKLRSKYVGGIVVAHDNDAQNVTSSRQFRNVNAVYGNDTCWITLVIFEIKAKLSLFETLINYFSEGQNEDANHGKNTYQKYECQLALNIKFEGWALYHMTWGGSNDTVLHIHLNVVLSQCAKSKVHPQIFNGKKRF